MYGQLPAYVEQPFFYGQQAHNVAPIQNPEVPHQPDNIALIQNPEAP